MRPGPTRLAQLLFEVVPLSASPRAVDEICAEVIQEQGWETTALTALESAERWSKGTLARVRQRLSEFAEVGRPAAITFNSSSDYLIQGACFVEPGDPPDLINKKQRRLRSAKYAGLFRQLTPDEFEVLCAKLLNCLGVEDAEVTRHSADEGIDFFGRVRFEDLIPTPDLTTTVQKQLSVWLVGQAKRNVRTNLGTPVVRDLVGAVQLARAGVHAHDLSPFANLKIRVADPVIAIVVTTGSLSTDAWNVLKRSGVVGMDGEMVAAFFADRGVGPNPDDVDLAQLRAWLTA